MEIELLVDHGEGPVLVRRYLGWGSCAKGVLKITEDPETSDTS
jgi:predicted NUDIX family NTP pyrophosphohydrolase